MGKAAGRTCARAGTDKGKGKNQDPHDSKSFDIDDFLKFYGLEIDNETDNDLGHCIA